jgi:hypothetical protein
MPLPDYRARFRDRRWSPDRDQHDLDGGHGNRSRGVHGNAQGTAVGGIFVRMDVRYLNHGQQRQQDQTQNRGGGQST